MGSMPVVIAFGAAANERRMWCPPAAPDSLPSLTATP